MRASSFPARPNEYFSSIVWVLKVGFAFVPSVLPETMRSGSPEVVHQIDNAYAQNNSSLMMAACASGAV